MDWTKLDISRAAVLKKEVDLSMKFLKEAVFNGQDTRIQELLTSFWSQIAAIDSFCMEHHDDERSVLLGIIIFSSLIDYLIISGIYYSSSI